MDIFNEFATDTKKEEEGRWVDYDDKTAFLIARSGNKNFARVFTRAYNQNKSLLNSKNDTAEAKANEVLAEVMAETILLGWKGPVKLKGEELAYSAQNAKKLLVIKDFRAWVQGHADDFSGFKAAEEAEEAKN